MFIEVNDLKENEEIHTMTTDEMPPYNHGDHEYSRMVYEKIFFESNVPVGTVKVYFGGIIPPDWLECDGRRLFQENYPELYAVIGTTYTCRCRDEIGAFSLPLCRFHIIKSN